MASDVSRSRPARLLRAVILALVLLVAGGAFWINYAASVAFFLLAIVGLGIGLANGFARNSDLSERLVALGFGLMTAAAIISYSVGMQTDIGFRMLGRDLRFLLFFPIYMAIKWAAPRVDFLAAGTGIGLASGVVYGLVQLFHGELVQGVAATHIVFGDGLVISGFICAGLFGFSSRRQGWRGLLFGVVAIAVGILGSLESGVRGAWIAIPVLLVMYLSGVAGKKSKILFLSGVSVLLAAIIMFPLVRNAVVNKVHETQRSYHDYAVGSRPENRKIGCINNEEFLNTLVRYGRIVGGDKNVEITRQSGDNAGGGLGCPDRFSINVKNVGTSAKPVIMILYRGRSNSDSQVLSVLARGHGYLRAGWTGEQVPISSKLMRRYEAKGFASGTLSLQVLVASGHSVDFIPIQQYRGEYTDALTRSSFGNRMAMWRLAMDIYSRHWLTGLGVGAFMQDAQNAIQAGRANPSLGEFQHPHNGFLNWLYGAGTLGIIALLSILILPVICVFSRPAARRPMLFLVTGTFICLLTESLFVHSLWISWYTCMVAILMSVKYTHEPGDTANAAGNS